MPVIVLPLTFAFGAVFLRLCFVDHDPAAEDAFAVHVLAHPMIVALRECESLRFSGVPMRDDFEPG
jgi:hypothetical protein